MGRHGVRTPWEEVPAHVREQVDLIAGARILSATNLQGGFSPGPAARCLLADGRTVFVKAAGLALSPVAPGMHRREAEALRSLAATVPAPSLIGVFDDDDWVALVIEWIDGIMPIAPLNTDDVARIVGLVERLARCEGGSDLLPCVDAHLGLGGQWKLLCEEPPDGLDTWTKSHLGGLADLESDVAAAVLGDRLVHLDVRSDNMIFAASGPENDVIVDWPGASVGAAWIDLVALLPSLELDGGPRPEDIFGQTPIGRAADPDAVDIFLATIAGYFTRMSLLPPPPGLPTVREFQAAQGVIARRWLGQRLGWAPA